MMNTNLLYCKKIANYKKQLCTVMTRVVVCCVCDVYHIIDYVVYYVKLVLCIGITLPLLFSHKMM